MKKLLLLQVFFLLSLISYAQEDTAMIRKAFDFLNGHRQDIADSIVRPQTADQFPKEKYYRIYLKRKEQSDRMFLHACFIPCGTYYVYDSTRIKTINGRQDSNPYPEFIYHSKEYAGDGYVLEGSKYKLFYTFYFIDNKHFSVIKVFEGPGRPECTFYYDRRIIFGTSDHFDFELNANNEIILKSAYEIIHN